ncbi:MAG: site-specific integrase [Planctomycetes bacterium]|nr:site-specific integrase [Planctomycetota bacterium]
MRPHHPWYRSATNSWYVEIAGQQELLGRHPENTPLPRKRKRGDPPLRPPQEIETAYHRLMAADPANLPKASHLRVAVVCDLFLDFSEKHHIPDTFHGYQDFLQDFCEKYGTLLARDLKPLHVSRWLDAHPGWNGSRRNAIVAVKRVFNWADAEGVLQPNPIKAVKKPPQRHRDRVLTPEERKEIHASIKDQSFRDFVFAMEETGARPGEVRNVTAAHVNLDLGLWIFKDHKTAKRTGKPRIIYLTPALLELTRRLVEKYPEGPLFRGPRSKQGFSRNGVRCRFRILREKLPHLAGVISYTMRHSFATQALVNGVGIAHVAELLGHVDTSMVSQHYAHLAGLRRVGQTSQENPSPLQLPVRLYALILQERAQT